MKDHQEDYHFISYSGHDAGDFPRKLHDALSKGEHPIRGWLDEDRVGSHRGAWSEQLEKAIEKCDSLLFVMTRDSVKARSICTNEWTHALDCGKPVILLRLHSAARIPLRLNTLSYIDFTADAFTAPLKKLSRDLRSLASSKGQLEDLQSRLEHARWGLRHADTEQQARIQDDIDSLEEQIAHQQRVVENPQEAERLVEESIERGLEREREPEKPSSDTTRIKFINAPPGIAPDYWQDRDVETKLVGDFLQNDALRLISVVGRSGIGKTVMVCRLLKWLESGRLPYDGEPLGVDGIVYLSEIGSHRVTVENLYTGLCKLLPQDVAGRLENVYKDPQASTEAKINALLQAFSSGRYVLLLDNFESVLDKTHNISDAELDEALRALLSLPHHAVKVIMTTRFAPSGLALVHPQRQRTPLNLDEGLPSPYAENILREMDVEGKLGLKTAPEELLDQARQRTSGNPRALEHLFAILSNDWDTSLHEILDDTKGLLPDEVFHVLVGEAFSRLDPAAQMVMQALALYARPVTRTAVDYLLQPHQLGVDSAPVLKRLVNMQLVRKEAGDYYLHEIDRAYAFSRVPGGEVADRGKTEAPPFTRFALLHRAADYFEQTRTPQETWRTIEDLAPQLAEFELRYAGEDYDTAARALLEIGYDYLVLWGNSRLMAELHERLQGKLSDPELKQRSVGDLGVAYRNMGRYRRAVTCFEQAVGIARAINHMGCEGAWLANLGNCYSILWQIERAIDHYEQALEIAREIPDRRGEGVRIGGLGNCYVRLGQTERATDHYQQALEIAREVEDRRAEGRWLGHLGDCYATLGQTQRAMDHYQHALDIALELGDRGREGRWLGSLGSCYETLGQTEGAMEHYQQALEIAREVRDRGDEGRWLGHLGTCCATMGQTEHAMDRYQHALDIARELSDRGREGVWLSNLGSCYSALGQSERAMEHYEQALEIAREIGDRGGEAFRLGNIGELLIREGEMGKAARQYEAAIRIADEISYSQVQNEARYGLALAYLYAGNLTAARAAAETARQYDEPQNNANVRALLGVIALRQGDQTAAQEAFEAAVAQAEVLLGYSERNYTALDSKGLALCGLALCKENSDYISAAKDAYRAARTINKDTGIVGDVLRLFDALAQADPAGMLAGVRAAAAGE